MNHNHRWNFLMTKTSFEGVQPPILPDVKADDARLTEFLDGQLYRHNEYAYLICNGPHDNRQPIVVKVEIEKLDQVELAND